MLKVRLRRVMKRNKLAEQIKDQQELLVNLQEQVKRNIHMPLIVGENVKMFCRGKLTGAGRRGGGALKCRHFMGHYCSFWVCSIAVSYELRAKNYKELWL